MTTLSPYSAFIAAPVNPVSIHCPLPTLSPLRPNAHMRSNSCPTLMLGGNSATNLQSMRIKTEESITVPEIGRAASLSTDGIGCCIALAMRGTNKEKGEREVHFAHLDSE